MVGALVCSGAFAVSDSLDFTQETRKEAYERQRRMCAHCGHVLGRDYEHAHHVFPNQTKDPDNPSHEWLASVDNCVVLCGDCDVKLHRDGRFRVGAVSPARDFPFSHGRKSAKHRAWAAKTRHRFFGGDK